MLLSLQTIAGMFSRAIEQSSVATDHYWKSNNWNSRVASRGPFLEGPEKFRAWTESHNKNLKPYVYRAVLFTQFLYEHYYYFHAKFNAYKLLSFLDTDQ